MLQVEEALVVLELLLLDVAQLVIAPALLLLAHELAAVAREVRAVADRGGALLAEDLALLVHVGGVAAREHGGPGELRLGELVVEQHALVADAVARLDARAVHPPLIAAEQHVRGGDVALDRGRSAVAVVGADGERLRADETPEAALRGERLVEVERVRVLHALRPAPDVVRGDRVLQVGAPERHTDPAVDVRRVELLARHAVSVLPVLTDRQTRRQPIT